MKAIVCVVRALARFIDSHVTQFQPIASAHFEMRYNNIIWLIQEHTYTHHFNGHFQFKPGSISQSSLIFSLQ